MKRFTLEYWLKSRFIREELLRLALLVSLFLWALTATFIALSKTERTILIGVSDEASYVISDSKESVRKKEIVSFIRNFVSNYYDFSSSTYEEKMSRSGDLMTKDLWDSKRDSLTSISAKLKTEPLSQEARIVSIDQVDNNSVEVILQIQIARKLSRSNSRLKVILKISDRTRTETNPWPFEISEVSDAVI